MKKIKYIVILLLITSTTYLSAKLLILYMSAPYSNTNTADVNLAKKDTPPYKWVIGNDDMIPHIRLYFWIPINSSHYKAFADEGIKTYVLGHGTIDKWEIKETAITSYREKLVYIYIPKTFILFYGKNFYNLIHLYYK